MTLSKDIELDSRKGLIDKALKINANIERLEKGIKMSEESLAKMPNFTNRHDVLKNKDVSSIKKEISFNKEIPLEVSISNTFNSPEYLQTLREFPEDARERVIGLSLEYLIINRDGYNFNEYIKELKNISPQLEKSGNYLQVASIQKELIVKSVIDKLHITDMNVDDSKRKVIDYIANNYLSEGYLFHSFNGIFEESIKKDGISTEKRFWDWDEINNIADICKKGGLGEVLGWARINCKGKTSIAEAPNGIYRYAVASPEWFAQFVSEGLHISNEEPYDKKAFYNRDYEAAKKNVKMFVHKLNASNEEKQEVLIFFEKYWNILANEKSVPKLALIKKRVIQGNAVDNFIYDKLKEEYLFDECLELILTHSGHDIQIEQNIKPEDIIITDLPEYNKIFREG